MWLLTIFYTAEIWGRGLNRCNDPMMKTEIRRGWASKLDAIAGGNNWHYDENRDSPLQG